MNEKNSADFVPFHKAAIGQEEEQAVLRVLRSGWLTTGKEAQSFEREFADFVGAKDALATNSATSGLLLAYEAAGIRAGTKILTSPYTFTSTANAARHLGAEVAYADIEPDSYSISPEKVECALKNDKTIRVVAPIHIAGNPCDIKKICEIADFFNVRVIEDCAHAFPSQIGKKFAGTFGSAGVFSFYATKTITTAEGGMITSDDEKMLARMRLMRLHGIDRTVWNRYTSQSASWVYDVADCGFKCNMPDILAAIGREQLKKANFLFKKREKIAKFYNSQFSALDFCQIPPNSDGNAWHLYLLRLNLDALKIGRDEFAALLQQEGVGISVHFIPHHRLSFWKNRCNLKAADFPNAEKAFLRTITLPLFPDETETQAQKVVEAVKKIGKKFLAK